MTDRKLTDLCPELQTLGPQFVERCASVGIQVRIVVTWRSPAEQDEVKAKKLSNASAGQSPHNHINAAGQPCSLAFDFVVFDHGQPIWNGTDERYTRSGAIAKGLGLTWGGDFHSKPDYDHVELMNWRNYGKQSTTTEV